MPRIVGILLAAGAGTRFGGDKLLAPLPRASHVATTGTPLGVAAAMHLIAVLPESLAVVRPHDHALSDALRATGLRVVPCGNADDGLGASLACGVSSTADADGWVIALADMPWIAPASLRAVRDALAQGADIVAPSYHGVRGHPVGFARRHVDALMQSIGESGARMLIERHRDTLTLLDVDDAGVIRDVDTRGDLASDG